MRVLFAATHPEQSTGYARVGHRVANYLARAGHEVHYFAFQRYGASSISRDIHAAIQMIDVHAVADEGDTFGINIIAETTRRVRPDVLLVYNDILVTCRILNALLDTPKTYRMISYLDLVYPYESWELVHHIKKHADHIFVFSEFWRTNLCTMGVPMSQIGVFPHGIDECVAPVLRTEARARLGFADEDYLVLNTNRNSYRKALDITVRAFLMFWKALKSPQHVKLVLNCVMDVPEGYDILHLVRIESLKLGLDYTVVTRQILRLRDAPGMLSDATVNDMYNACDVGLNTCVGEGFGLCNLEHASLGRPQIVTDVGGLGDIFRPVAGRGATLVPAETVLTIARGIDWHSGDIRIPRAEDFARALASAYATRHHHDDEQATNALRTHVATTYAWPALLDAFHSELMTYVEPTALSEAEASPEAILCPRPPPPVVWINLDDRADRRARMEARLLDLGVKDHARVSARVDPEGRSWMSCMHAHHEAIRTAYSLGCDVAVIASDDAVLRPGFFEELDVYLARLPTGWGAFQAHYTCPALLGYLASRCTPRTVARGYMTSAACYAYSRAGMTTFLEKMGRDSLDVLIDPATARVEELVFRYVDTYMAMHPLAATDESLSSWMAPPEDAWASDILRLPYHCHWVRDEQAAAALFVKKTPGIEGLASSMKMKAFVINLDKNVDRWEVAKSSYANADVSIIPMERFRAIEGTKVDPSVWLNEHGKRELMQVEKDGYRTRHYQLTRGAIGCFVSHYMLAQKLVDDPVHEFYLVLEDDAAIPQQTLVRIHESLDQSPSNWDVLLLGTHRVCGLHVETFIKISAFFGTFGYVINKKGARKFVEWVLRTKIDAQVDSYMAVMAQKGELNVYATKTQIIHDNYQLSRRSDIQNRLVVKEGVDPFIYKNHLRI